MKRLRFRRQRLACAAPASQLIQLEPIRDGLLCATDVVEEVPLANGEQLPVSGTPAIFDKANLPRTN